MTKPIYSRHHRKCRSNGGGDDNRNISYLPLKKHRAWHLLFGNKEPKEIAREINVLYLDPDYEFIVRRKK